MSRGLHGHFPPQKGLAVALCVRLSALNRLSVVVASVGVKKSFQIAKQWPPDSAAPVVSVVLPLVLRNVERRK